MKNGARNTKTVSIVQIPKVLASGRTVPVRNDNGTADMKLDEIVVEAVKQRLDPKCWKGKHKEGTKIKGGVRVNNCVPNESIEEHDEPCCDACAAQGTTCESDDGVISGKEMLNIFKKMHHEHGYNKPMERWIAKQTWSLDTIEPEQLQDMYNDDEDSDPFERTIWLDDAAVTKYERILRAGQLVNPIIMGPNRTVIDGNHRAQAAKNLHVSIPGYVPIKKSIDESKVTPSAKYLKLAKDLEDYANKHIPKSQQGFGDFMYHAELIRKGHQDVHKQDLKTVQQRYRKTMDDMIKQHLDENFADGKGPGRPGDSKRHGIPKHASLATLDKLSKQGGRKGQLARWQANMRRGRANARESLEEALFKASISFPDGNVYLTDHLFDREDERAVGMRTVAHMITYAARHHSDELTNIGPENFVIRNKAGVGIGVAKVLQLDGTYKYIIRTVHPKLRTGRDQTVIRLGSDRTKTVTENELGSYMPLNLAQLKELLDIVHEQQEVVDDQSFNLEPDTVAYKQIERDYQSLTAIEYVVKNNIKALKNPALQPGAIFVYDWDGYEDEIGAIQVQVTDGAAEIKWLGSYNSIGKQLIAKGLEQAKQLGAKKVNLTSKWGSGEYYKKQGFKQANDVKDNPISDTGASFTKDIDEASQQYKKISPKLINEIVAKLPQTNEIWFHGSRATGTHKRDSDWDILVIVPDDIKGNDYIELVMLLQKIASDYPNYDIQPAHAHNMIARIAREEGVLLWSDKPPVTEAIAPHGDSNNELRMMKAGTKPAAIIGPVEFEHMYKPLVNDYGWEVVGLKNRYGQRYVIGQMGEYARIKRIADMVNDMNKKMEQGVRPRAEYHIELGRLLGYSEQDIEDFLHKISVNN